LLGEGQEQDVIDALGNIPWGYNLKYFVLKSKLNCLVKTRKIKP